MRTLRWAALLLAASAWGHVGVKDVYFEGLAGPYPLSVVIRPPSVIPGVAEVSVRAGAKDVDRIRLTTMTLTGAGSKYPPTPEAAQRSKQDPQTFSGSSWLMVPGAWQVRITVEGARGNGVLAVPVAALSDRVAVMDRQVGIILVILIGLLVLGAVGIAGAAITEARVAPGGQAQTGRALWGTRLASALVAGLVLWFGWQWWEQEALAYAESIYRPLAIQAKLEGQGLAVELQHTGWYQKKSLDDFIEDHGHRMHLFLVEEKSGRAIYHLHPRQQSAGRFRFALPAMPAGRYRAFADVLHRNGLAETLVTSVEIPAFAASAAAGGDDAGCEVGENAGGVGRPVVLANGWKVKFEGSEDLVAGRALQLRFQIEDQDGNPVKNLQPYLGMPGHLVLLRKDLQVFAHLHPAGTASMSAVALAQEGIAPTPDAGVGAHGTDLTLEGEMSFPFGFPRSGDYRVLLQFRDARQIYSAPFDFSVR